MLYCHPALEDIDYLAKNHSICCCVKRPFMLLRKNGKRELHHAHIQKTWSWSECQKQVAYSYPLLDICRWVIHKSLLPIAVKFRKVASVTSLQSLFVFVNSSTILFVDKLKMETVVSSFFTTPRSSLKNCSIVCEM